MHCMRAAGLEDVKTILSLHPFEMSGGMLQRMMIALALLSEAPFLFADEPTTDLDLVVQLRVLELLEKLVEERDLGILLVTHDMASSLDWPMMSPSSIMAALSNRPR